MATAAEMDMFKSRVQTSEPLTWAVQGLPVVALFKTSQGAQGFQHLGQPSPHNVESDVLLLWIGFAKNTRKLLVILTLRLKMGANRRTRRNAQRKDRLMFLIVPTESLTLRSADVAYRSLAEEDQLRTLLDVPNDADSEKCKLMDMSFDIGADMSYVIMKADQYTGPMQKQSMSLLRRFKTLSEISRFRLFANHDEGVQGCIEDIQAMLMGDNKMITPEIDLHALYPGRRKAGINLWTCQGWREDESADGDGRDGADTDVLPVLPQPVVQKAPISSRQCPSLSPTRIRPSSSPPPAYASQRVPSLPSTVVPGSCHTPPGNLLRTSVVRDGSASNVPPCDEPTSPGIPPSPVSPYERIFPSESPSPPSPLEPSLSCNYTADLLSDLAESRQPSPSAYNAAVPTDPALGHVQPADNNMRASTCSGINASRGECVTGGVESESRHAIAESHLAVQGHTRAGDNPCVSESSVLDTPSRKRASPFTNDNIAKRFTITSADGSQQRLGGPSHHLGSDYHQGILRDMYDAGITLSPTVVDELSDPDILLSPRPLDSSPNPVATIDELTQSRVSMTRAQNAPRIAQDAYMTEWLIHAWETCPSAHYLFIAELLRLGAAAVDNDADALDNCRVACTMALISHCTKERLETPSGLSDVRRQVAPSTINHGTRVAFDALPALIWWLYILDPENRMNFLPDLLRLSVTEQQLLQSSHNDRTEYDDLSSQYIRQKADIVSRACVRFGKEILERGEREIVSRMLRERELRGLG